MDGCNTLFLLRNQSDHCTWCHTDHHSLGLNGGRFFETFFSTARKRSLGQGNIFSNMRLTVRGGGGLCMMSLHVWLPGPMFLPGEGAPCAWSHVPWMGGGVSVQGGLCQGDSSGQRLPHTVKGGWYASYWNTNEISACQLVVNPSLVCILFVITYSLKSRKTKQKIAQTDIVYSCNNS